MFLLQMLQTKTGHRQDILSHLWTLRDVQNGKHALVDQGIEGFHDRPSQLHGLSDAFTLNPSHALAKLL
jgi:hypothetical protein